MIKSLKMNNIKYTLIANVKKYHCADNLTIKTTLVLLFILHNIIVKSQDWTSTNGNINTGVVAGIKIINNEVEYFSKRLSYPTTKINRINLSTGQKTIKEIYIGDVLGISKTKSNGWYFLTGGKSCDTYDKMEVHVMDSIYQTIDTYTLHTAYNGKPIESPDIKTFTNTNNDFWVITPYFLYIIHDNNNQIQILGRPSNKIGTCTPLLNSKILIGGIKANTPHLYTFNSNGGLEDSIPTPKLFTHLVQSTNKHWYALSENAIFHLDSEFQVIKSHQFSFKVESAVLKLMNDTLYTVVNSNTGSNYMLFNKALSLVFNQYNSHKGVRVKDFEILNDHRIVFVSTLITHDYKHEALLTVRSKYAGNTLNIDLRLDKTKLLNCWEKPHYVFNHINYDTYYTPEITVTNLSPFVLDSFYYNVELKTMDFCSPVFHSELITTDMRPYETRTFRLRETSIFTYSSVLNNFQICGFVSLPNGESDKNINNDRLCTYKDGSLVGTENQVLLNASAYYDQNIDALILKDIPTHANIKIISSSGQLINSLKSEYQSILIPFDDYCSGVYVLQLEFNGVYKSIKILKLSN